MSLTRKLDEVPALVIQRGLAYGHPAEDFRRVSAMEQVLMECPDPEIRHVLFMLATKLSRLVQTPDHEDSWVDIVGYAHTAAMVLDERRRAAETVEASGLQQEGHP